MLKEDAGEEQELLDPSQERHRLRLSGVELNSPPYQALGLRFWEVPFDLLRRGAQADFRAGLLEEQFCP